MTWTAYQVAFRLLSPMHIGRRKIGNLQQTQYYVTGRSLWGAIVARMVREAGKNNYDVVGQEIDKYLAFTYFYPSTEKDTLSLYPWLKENRENEEFIWTFLGSYASTAIVNGRNAEDGSLHETEFIAPYTRSGLSVFLVGYIFEHNLLPVQQNLLSNWRGVLDKLQFGGERGYGWGRVQIVHCSKLEGSGTWLDYAFVLGSDRPQLAAQKDTYLLAHTLTSNISREGVIEPFVGRETRNSTGFGKTISSAICWTPGSKATANEIFQIENRGIWKA